VRKGGQSGTDKCSDPSINRQLWPPSWAEVAGNIATEMVAYIQGHPNSLRCFECVAFAFYEMNAFLCAPEIIFFPQHCVVRRTCSS